MQESQRKSTVSKWRRRRDSNPRYPDRVRFLSRELVSATHPRLRIAALSRRRGAIDGVRAAFKGRALRIEPNPRASVGGFGSPYFGFGSSRAHCRVGIARLTPRSHLAARGRGTGHDTSGRTNSPPRHRSRFRLRPGRRAAGRASPVGGSQRYLQRTDRRRPRQAIGTASPGPTAGPAARDHRRADLSAGCGRDGILPQCLRQHPPRRPPLADRHPRRPAILPPPIAKTT